MVHVPRLGKCIWKLKYIFVGCCCLIWIPTIAASNHQCISYLFRRTARFRSPTLTNIVSAWFISIISQTGLLGLQDLCMRDHWSGRHMAYRADFFVARSVAQSHGRHLVKSTWRHNSVGDHPICIQFGRPVQNHMPMTLKRSKTKPEVEFQYGGRLFVETGSIVISWPWIEISGRNLVCWYL